VSRWFRRGRLPAELRPPLDPDERLVAWAAVADPAGAAVATTAGLFLPGRERRLGWHEIHRASWSGRALTVTPAEVVAERPGYLVTADRAPVTVPLAHPGDLPRVVRSRVTRSVPFSSRHRVPGGGVLVVARRVPGVDGLCWAVRYDPGTDPGAPAVRAATDALVAAHRTARDPG
jgi:hypothetical protein